MKLQFALFFLAPLHFAYISTAFAEDLCPQEFAEIARTKQSSSVELEMGDTKDYIDVFTTRSGKAGSLIEEAEIEKIPPHVLNYFGAKTKEDLLSKDWDSLSKDQKYALMDFVSKNSRLLFFEDRSFPGLVIRDRMSLKFSEPTEFLGQLYPAGESQVSLQGILGKVEYEGPQKSPDSLELHFRARLPAGAVSNSARVWQKAVGAAATHQHVHIVAKIPLEKIKEEPNAYPALLGDFFRRVNLVAEMRTLLEDRGVILTRKKGIITEFGGITPSDIEGVINYFDHFYYGGDIKIGDEFKMGWVGFRGSDTYDELNLYGLEYRAIPKNADQAKTEKMLNAVQAAMTSESYGVPLPQMKRWLELYRPGRSSGGAISETFYNQPLKNLLKSLNPEIKNAFGLVGRLKIKGAVEQNQAVKMLLFDWSKDPLLFENPALQQKVFQAQLSAVRDFGGGARANQVLRSFLLDSGLYDELSRSLHL